MCCSTSSWATWSSRDGSSSRTTRSPPASTCERRRGAAPMSGLPAWIGGALGQKLEHVSRAALRERAQAASEAYRACGTSEIIRSDLDALAYAMVRMPATYAAVRACLTQTTDLLPSDF